jgi:hypothetical protein
MAPFPSPLSLFERGRLICKAFYQEENFKINKAMQIPQILQTISIFSHKLVYICNSLAPPLLPKKQQAREFEMFAARWSNAIWSNVIWSSVIWSSVIWSDVIWSDVVWPKRIHLSPVK